MKTNKLHGYKYTIYDRLRKLPVEDYEIAMRWLPEKLGITTATFRNWIYTKAPDKLELPATAILKMAIFFDCQPLELFSYPFNTEKIIVEWNDERESEEKSKQMQFQFYEAL
jgi:hypothetical protein